MDRKPSNPYYALQAVREPQMFFGRARTLRNLYSAIVHRQSMALVGPRHIGKSSILQCMRFAQIQEAFHEDLSRHILVFIDLREYRQKTVDDFFEAVSKEIVAECRGRLWIILQDQEGEEKFASILDQVNEQGYHPTLLMDAFDAVARNPRFDFEFFGFLRAQARKASYITASIAPLKQVCHNDILESPFFNIFGQCDVGPLADEETYQLVTEPAHRAGIPFTEEEVDWILARAGRHPFFIQRVCHHLFEEKCLQENGVVNRKHVRSQAYNDLHPHFEATWERLSEAEREILKNEAQRGGERIREMPELSESSLFRHFVRVKCQTPLFRMEIDNVQEVLDKLDDTRVLGESDLKHLRVVSMRVKQDGVASQVERGMAVREVLNEAFERMRGNGMRRDEAAEWRHYNILYHRYFKNHLKNEQISARLEFTSIRQYYRERNKAIEVLFNNLLEMETAASGEEDD